MTTILNFKDIIDLSRWRPIAFMPTAHGNGAWLVSDYRNNIDRYPFIYSMFGTTNFNIYDTKTDQWQTLSSPALGNFTAGALGVFMPAQGPRGTLAAGATTTTITLATALPAAVGVNQLANRGDDRGFKIRIIGNAAGSSGKTEERLIITNTSGTTPVITLDTPLSFAPILGDSYEILSGRVFLYGSGNLVGTWKYYDIATNSFSGNLSVVNLGVGIGLDSTAIGLDEAHVPYNRSPGDGYLGTLIATASGAASLTGQAVGGDASVLADEYRNFQIRIVQDTAIPTAVGQRRNITTHTAGPSPVYTVPAWAVQPSATASYVIENNGDRILLWQGNAITTFTYTISGNAWDAGVTFANKPVGTATGNGSATVHSFGIVPDVVKNSRQSFIFQFRGNSTAIDLFDIAGAATGLWTSAITYGNSSTNLTFASNTSSVYDPATNGGRYFYLNIANSKLFVRFDVIHRIIELVTTIKYSPPTVASESNQRMALALFIDGNTKLSFMIHFFMNDQNIFYLPIIKS